MITQAFPYYGTKYGFIDAYPKPHCDRIIEPFAGAAAYAQRYWSHDVLLIDLDPYVVKAWEFLIAAKPGDIRSLPDLTLGTDLDRMSLSEGERALMRFWINPGSTGRSRWTRFDGIDTRWEIARERLTRACRKYDHWKVIHGSYAKSPDVEATWFVDPPYQGKAGRYYRSNNTRLNFARLAGFCMSRQGQVIVCEGKDATWLPFKPIKRIRGQTGNRVAECIWYRDRVSDHQTDGWTP